jgi:hypothetical protein
MSPFQQPNGTVVRLASTQPSQATWNAEITHWAYNLFPSITTGLASLCFGMIHHHLALTVVHHRISGMM